MKAVGATRKLSRLVATGSLRFELKGRKVHTFPETSLQRMCRANGMQFRTSKIPHTRTPFRKASWQWYRRLRLTKQNLNFKDVCLCAALLCCSVRGIGRVFFSAACALDLFRFNCV